MPHTSPGDAAPVSNDVVLAEVRGLASTMNARFDGVEREQSDMKGWMNRLTDELRSQAQVTGKVLSVETRLGTGEGERSDLKLELADLRDRVEKAEKDNVKSAVVRNGVVATVAAALSAGLYAIFGHVKVGL